jgi:hypothetical protein
MDKDEHPKILVELLDSILRLSTIGSSRAKLVPIAPPEFDKISSIITRSFGR